MLNSIVQRGLLPENSGSSYQVARRGTSYASLECHMLCLMSFPFQLLSVPPGSYKVTLHFAEIYFVRAGSSGKWEFDVFIQDSMAEEGVDIIYKRAGPLTASHAARVTGLC